MSKNNIHITVAGPQNSPTLPIARAILELLQGTDATCSMPEEAENPFDGDSIEQLGELRRSTRVVIQTSSAFVDDAPLGINRELTTQLVSRIQTWSVDGLLDELVADAARWCIGNCAIDPRAVTLALEQRLEELGIARKAHTQACTGTGGYFRTCPCPWVTPS